MNGALNTEAETLAHSKASVHWAWNVSLWLRALGFRLRSLLFRAAPASGVTLDVLPIPADVKARQSHQASRRGWVRELSVVGIIVAGLGALIGFSLYLAAMRIYQVDECMELYVAKILATAQDKAVAGHVTLFQVLLSWFIPATSRSVDLF
ncbi:MAG: hypothetical protein ACTHKU_02950, partial [Verrucomicrobiota bacterium]